MFHNSQGTLADVPEPIRHFYYEETRNEASGKQISEPYTFINEAGEEQWAERQVDEYIDITYLVQNSRQDLKTWSDVALAKRSSTYETTLHFIQKACESEGWVFHDAYVAWLEREPTTTDEFERQEWLSKEPVKSLTNQDAVLIGYHQELAKQNRDRVIAENINLYDVEWQIDKDGRDNMNEAIAYAERNALPGTTPRQWILADNSLRETTVDELRGVLNAYTERLDDVFSKYAMWRSTNQLMPFEYQGNMDSSAQNS